MTCWPTRTLLSSPIRATRTSIRRTTCFVFTPVTSAGDQVQAPCDSPGARPLSDRDASTRFGLCSSRSSTDRTGRRRRSLLDDAEFDALGRQLQAGTLRRALHADNYPVLVPHLSHGGAPVQ